MSCRLMPFIVLTALSATVAPTQLRAQSCDPDWLPGDGIAGLNGSVEALITWDPDGAGSAAPLLIAGGTNIEYSDTGPASNIVAFDGLQWSSLGAGVSGGSVTALAVFNNELIAGGHFTTAGGQPANRIARWDGTSWHTLGSGLNAQASALAVFNSELYAAGSFSTAGGVAASKIARWNGTSWSPVGTGLTGSPLTMAVANGSLFVGGGSTNAGGVAVSNLAKWNGTAWSSAGTINGWVNSLSVYSMNCFGCNSSIILGGSFTQVNGSSALHIAWLSSNGSFSAIGSGLTDPCRTVFVRDTGGFFSYEVIATTEDFPIVPQQVWRYTSSSGAWTAFGGFDHGFSKPLAYFGGQYVVGVYDSDGVTEPCVQSWDGTAWVPLGRGIAGRIYAFASFDGDTIAAGVFEFASNVRVNNIARRDAASGEWSALGSGISGWVNALLTLPSGELIAAGGFTSAGGTVANNIARWDGTSWSSLGTGLNGPIWALTLLANGDVVVGGEFTTAGGGTANRVARWNGTTWSAVGNGFNSGPVRALVERSNGDIIAGGYDLFGSSNDTQVARWNGTSWSPLLQLQSGSLAYTLVALPNGDIIAGGYFGPDGAGNNVRRWNGTTWTNLGLFDESVKALALLPNGDLVAVGDFTTIDMLPASRIARWNGTAWSALGTGIPVLTGFEIVDALAVLPNGELAVGGGYYVPEGGGYLGLFARWTDNPSPMIAVHPVNTSTGCYEPAIFETAAALGYEPVDYQWEIEDSSGVWTAIVDGSLTVNGQTVGTVAGAESVQLSVTPTSYIGQKNFRAVIYNDCGTSTSNPASLSIFDGSCACSIEIQCVLPEANACTFNQCAAGACISMTVQFGNVDGSAHQAPGIDDLLCELAGFSDFGNCPNGDITPNCAGNGQISLDDILAELGAFGGADPCGCTR